MDHTTFQILFFLDLLILLCVVFSHLVKKNFSLLNLFLLQSLAVSGILFTLAWQTNSVELFVGAAMTFLLKVVLVPGYFARLIKQHQVKTTGTSYLNTPLTLAVVAILTALAYSRLFVSLYMIAEGPKTLVQLSMAAMLVALFLLINRKGALSQIVGILSLENAILSFSSVVGVEQTLGLELGIAFDILVWVVVAGVFINMLYRQFGTLDVSALKDLKE